MTEQDKKRAKEQAIKSRIKYGASQLLTSKLMKLMFAINLN